jgi:hypothetical protein
MHCTAWPILLVLCGICWTACGKAHIPGQRSSAVAETSTDAAVSQGDAAETAQHSDAEAFAADATFDHVFAILSEHCMPCHASSASSSNPAGKLDLSTRSVAYEQMVGIAAMGGACSSRSQLRVAPGDSTGSLLIEKLLNSDGLCGGPMPKPAMGEAFAPIAAGQIAEIAAWIEAGAK